MSEESLERLVRSSRDTGPAYVVSLRPRWWGCDWMVETGPTRLVGFSSNPSGWRWSTAAALSAGKRKVARLEARDRKLAAWRQVP